MKDATGMKNYVMYSITMTVPEAFMFGPSWNWYFPRILVYILAILKDGAILTIFIDNVVASPHPDCARCLSRRSPVAVAITIAVDDRAVHHHQQLDQLRKNRRGEPVRRLHEEGVSRRFCWSSTKCA